MLNSELTQKLSLESLILIFDTLKDPLIIGSASNGNLLYANKSFCNLFGYTNDELSKLNFLSLHPQELHDFILKEFHRDEDRKGQFHRVKCVTKSGDVFFSEINDQILTLDNEQYVVASFKDITTDVELQKKTLNQDVVFNQIFESDTIVRLLLSVGDGKILEANRAAQKFYGYTHEELISMKASDINTLSDQEVRYLIEETKKSNRGKFNFQHRLKDGSIKDVEVYSVPININNEIFLFSSIFDVTKQKETERKFKTLEERWRFAIESSGNGVWDLNLKTNKYYMSSNWMKMIGFEVNNDIDIEEWNRRVHPDDISNLNRDFLEHISGKTEAFINTHRFLNDSGNYVHVLSKGKIIEWDEQGKPLRMIGIQTDISEQEMLRNKLVDINEHKNMFIKILAHDLRTPFSSLLGFSNLLLKEDLNLKDNESRRILGLINSISKSTHDLLEELLLWSKYSDDEIQVNKQSYSFIDITSEMIDSLKYISDKKNITVNISEEELSIIEVDIDLYKIILRNLFTNAVKFSNENSSINITCVRDEFEYVISVQDHGLGMSLEEVDKLWAANFNHTKRGTKGESGSGLGLTMCKDLIEKMDGRIWVNSRLNEGSTFKIALPI